jgi:hypothetical protein
MFSKVRWGRDPPAARREVSERRRKKEKKKKRKKEGKPYSEQQRKTLILSMVSVHNSIGILAAAFRVEKTFQLENQYSCYVLVHHFQEGPRVVRLWAVPQGEHSRGAELSHFLIEERRRQSYF